MRLSPGTRLGTYEVLGPLGAGGMGEVYRAKDLRLGREVAVKVLPREVASSPDRLARFEREARTVGGLNHPNIVVLHSIEEEDGVRFLTMELVEGQSLTNLIPPGGLPLLRILELSIPLTDALVAAHERGVIHRDLKPGNVMVTREGRVKVLDFGLAKMLGSDTPVQGEVLTATAGSSLSGEGDLLGTVPYMSPEQLRGEPADARSDLFAFGIVLYELATGHRPFTGETSIDISHAILHGTPEPVTRVRTDLPADLERIVSRCLEKNRRERAQSALDVNNELRRLRRVLERGEPEKPASDKVASIAVLAFVNRSASAEDEYFSDGLADELLNMLAKIKGLHVSARTSSFTFKGQRATVAEIGKALNVATVLEGSVRKAGNRVRISVQLVKVSDGYHLWSEAYDRTLEDIFAVQDDIAQSVVKELRTTLLGEEPDSSATGKARTEVAMAAKGHGQNPEAHRLYLQGKYFLDRANQEDTARAIQYLDEAVTLDPKHLFAWLELSRAYGMTAGYGLEPIPEAHRKASDAVDRAIALAPDSAEAYVRRANIQIYLDWDLKGAEASLRRALELAPNSDAALRSRGSLDAMFGRFDEAEALFKRASEQDPLNSFTYNSLGLIYRRGHRFEDAERAYRKALELAPQRLGSHSSLAIVLAHHGRDAEAIAAAQREPDDSAQLYALAHVHLQAGRRREVDEALQGLIESHAAECPAAIAEIHAARGDLDEALHWLERAIVARDTGVVWIPCDRTYRPLHGNPRWNAMMKKLGFE